MQKKQVFNPFLPLNEYIPDGEPHVFGDRVYLYGSHDREGGYTFCMEDYVVYSAPVDDLSDWRCEGVTYKASQDPVYPKLKYMYAPDVVKGNDGKYYLYYCMGGDYGIGGYTGHISVAVCDTPAGKYEYLGYVKNPDGTPMMKYVCFDPAVINDNGTIRIYYGTQYCDEENSGLRDVIEDYLAKNAYGELAEQNDKTTDGVISDHQALEALLNDEMKKVVQNEIEMFGRTKEEILSYPDSINGAITLTLEDDMLTVREMPKHIIPYRVKGTSFEDHPFFEGPSMRKLGDKYYFIYSSWLNHELCYAVSDHPDRDFTFGGTIVSNGDVGMNGRRAEDKLNMTGTTHGSICKINSQWYVFFHRLTHKSDYSRQACAEKINIEADGSIRQVEITSCGLNEGPLKGEGIYPAVIACNLTNGNMPHGSNSVYKMPFPNVNNLGDERFIAEVEDGTLIGYKYFDFKAVKHIGVNVRFENDDNRVVFDGPVRLDERCLEDEAKLHERLEGKAEEGKSFSDTGDVKTADNTGDGAEDKSMAHHAEAGLKDKCYIDIFTDINGDAVGRIALDYNEEGILIGGIYAEDNEMKNIDLSASKQSMQWHKILTAVNIEDGTHPLFFIYHGDRKIQIKDIVIEL